MNRGATLVRLVLAVLSAIGATLGTAALGRAAVGTARGQRLDQLVLTAAQADDSLLSRVVFPVLNTVTVPVVLIALAIAAALALLQRRPFMALHIVVLVAGAALTSQVIKHVLVDRTVLAEGLEVTPNSYPSGHTTIAAAVAVAVTLASPRHVRSPVALVAAAWTAIAGIGTIAGGWHRPSDVIGALLVVAAWSSLVLAVDALIALAHTSRGAREDTAEGTGVDSSSPRARRRGRGAITVLLAAAAAGLPIGAWLLAQVPTPLDLSAPSAQSTAYAATALIVSGAVCLLLAWVLLLHIPEMRCLPGAPQEHGAVRVR